MSPHAQPCKIAHFHTYCYRQIVKERVSVILFLQTTSFNEMIFIMLSRRPDQRKLRLFIEGFRNLERRIAISLCRLIYILQISYLCKPLGCQKRFATSFLYKPIWNSDMKLPQRRFIQCKSLIKMCKKIKLNIVCFLNLYNICKM